MAQNRFLVNGKYIIVLNPHLSYSGEMKVITGDILIRDDLERKDLIELKKKIKLHFSEKAVIKIRVLYIL